VIELAKPAVDVGLFTNNRDGLLAFWQTRVGVPFAELLPLGGGLQQHRHVIGDSVLKINHSREPLPPAPAAGIRRLSIGRIGIDLVTHLRDPDGNEVLLVPVGEVEQIRLTEGEAARDPEQQAPGYRYLTMQVFDVRGCHARIIAKGGREGRPPMRLGEVAHISFVRDPDGNWIEISQRKSITGSLD